MNHEEIQGLIKDEDYEQVIKILESQLSETTQKPELISLLIKSYNEFAIELLDKNHPTLALDILKKAENFSDVETELRSRTYNNIACCYKVQNKHVLALKYIEKAIFLHPSGDFHLNKCAILSMSGKHNKALEEAMFAVIYIQEEMLEKFIQNAEINRKKCEALAISYHNLAVELEYMRKVPESIGFYTKALNVCENFFESEGKLKEKLEEDMQMALKALQRPLRRPQESIFPVYSKKKRIVIKNSQSKSPVTRSQNTPIKRPELKEQKKKFTGRKFVSTGVSKLKMIELRKTQPAVIDQNENEEKFMQTERVFIEGIKLEDDESEEEIKKNNEGIRGAGRLSDSDNERGKSSFEGNNVRNEFVAKDDCEDNSSKENKSGLGSKGLKSDKEEYSEFNSSKHDSCKEGKNEISIGKKSSRNMESFGSKSKSKESGQVYEKNSNTSKNLEKIDRKSSDSSSETSKKASEKIHPRSPYSSSKLNKKNSQGQILDHSSSKGKKKSDLSNSKKFSGLEKQSEESSLHSLPSEYKRLMHEKSVSPKDSIKISEKNSKKSSIYSEKEEQEKWASIEKQAKDSYCKNSSFTSEKSKPICSKKESSKIKIDSNNHLEKTLKSSSSLIKSKKSNSNSSLRLLIDRKLESEHENNSEPQHDSHSSSKVDKSNKKSEFSKASNERESGENSQIELKNLLDTVYKNGSGEMNPVEETKILGSCQMSEIKPESSEKSSRSSIIRIESIGKIDSKVKFECRSESSQSLKIRERAANSQNFVIEKPLSSDSSLYKQVELIESVSNYKTIRKLGKNSEKSNSPSISSKSPVRSHKSSMISSKSPLKSHKSSLLSSKSPLKSSNYPSISNKSSMKSEKNSLDSKKSEKNPSISSKNSSIPNNSPQASKKSLISKKSLKSEPISPKTQVHITEKSPNTFSTSKNTKDLPKFKGLIIDTSFNDTNENLSSPSHISGKEEFLYIDQSSKISEIEKITFYSKKPSIQDSLSQESINFLQNEYNENLGSVTNKEKSEETNLDTIKNLRPEENKKNLKKKKFELSAEVSSSMGLEKLPEQDSEVNIRSSKNELNCDENPFNLNPSQENTNKNPSFPDFIDPFSLCKSIIDSVISQILS